MAARASKPTVEFIALLRGINVGGKAKLRMAELRELLEAEGYTEVRTLLQSGNVVLHAPAGTTPDALERALEAAIAKRFEMTVSCLVRSGDDLRSALAVNPLADQADDGRKMQIVFLSAEPDAAMVRENDPVALDPTRIVRTGRVVYQWCPDGILASPAVGTFVERKWKIRATARNWNTLQKLQAMLTADA